MQEGLEMFEEVKEMLSASKAKLIEVRGYL